MHNPQFFWLYIFLGFCIAPLNYATAANADVGVLLLDDLIHDLDATVGKMRERCISMAKEDFYSKHKDDLLNVPIGCREIPGAGKMLKVAVPEKIGFNEFFKVERDPENKNATVTGFCGEVFAEVRRSMPFDVQYIPFDPGNYDDIVKQISDGSLDAVVGDVTITADRSEFVDFTVPYIESSVAFLVPVKNNAWDFMKPMTGGLWLTIGGFFVINGFVIWVLEHRVNKEFRGATHQQFGMMLWFSFSTLVFAHREKVASNLTRFVLIVWVFVVLILTSSYQANLTARQLQPTITDICALMKKGEYVGYQHGSFVRGLILNNTKCNNMTSNPPNLRNYTSLEQFREALSNGSKNGGVAAIADELPYIRLLLRKYPDKYTIIGPNYVTSGLGFAFPKCSPLVAEFSRAIIKLKEDHERMEKISRWFGEEEEWPPSSDATEIASKSLGVDSFKGLFLIAGLSSSSALAIFFCTFFYETRYIWWISTASIKQKLYDLVIAFYREKQDTSSSSNEPTMELQTISIRPTEEAKS